MKETIPVIDLFAGPGGLGEGFATLKNNNKSVFDIALSIENNPTACKTLLLRKFFRNFPMGKAPDEYYEYLKGNLELEELYTLFPKEHEKAKSEILEATLGNTSNTELDKTIKEKVGNNKNWLLIGGPPCQAYSLVGRSVIKKIQKDDFDNDPRHLLYKEYLRIIAKHKPAVFVMENVVGLLSSKLNGELIFPKILEDLRAPLSGKKEYELYSFVSKGNSPKDFVVQAEKYGIPQKRHRVLILGIRKDIDIAPNTLVPHSMPITVDDVLRDLPKLRSGISKNKDSENEWEKIISNAGITLSNYNKKFIASVKNCSLDVGKKYVPKKSNDIIEELKNWYYDKKLDGVTDHISRSHIIEDIKRYLFASLYAEKNNTSPKLRNFPNELLPKHKNVLEAKKLDSVFNDRFRVQLKNEPSSTIISHISKDGHYFIHYDPTQARSLSPREAARLQTFPDNFKFEGNRTEQYHQIGNAVPPLLANKLAKVVWEIFKKI